MKLLNRLFMVAAGLLTAYGCATGSTLVPEPTPPTPIIEQAAPVLALPTTAWELVDTRTDYDNGTEWTVWVYRDADPSRRDDTYLEWLGEVMGIAVEDAGFVDCQTEDRETAFFQRSCMRGRQTLWLAFFIGAGKHYTLEVSVATA